MRLLVMESCVLSRVATSITESRISNVSCEAAVVESQAGELLAMDGGSDGPSGPYKLKGAQ
ncbi:MAG: hypothetical protein ACREPH_11175, partial [Rhodanobacteraceae bacterium]